MFKILEAVANKQSKDLIKESFLVKVTCPFSSKYYENLKRKDLSKLFIYKNFSDMPDSENPKGFGVGTFNYSFNDDYVLNSLVFKDYYHLSD